MKYFFEQIIYLGLSAYFLCMGKVFAQNETDQSINLLEQANTYIYNYHWGTGGGLHTQGFVLSTFFLKKKSLLRGISAQISFGSYHHPKEFSVIKIGRGQVRPFAYGKMNFVFFNHFSVGFWQVIFEKYQKKGLEIAIRAQTGLSLAYLKPVFLRVIDPSDHHEVVEQQYDPDKHAFSAIIGQASFFKGFGDIRLSPGFHISSGLNFDWYKPRKKDLVGAFEIGFLLDIYPMGLSIMAYNPPNYLIAVGYLSLFFGQKKI